MMFYLIYKRRDTVHFSIQSRLYNQNFFLQSVVRQTDITVQLPKYLSENGALHITSNLELSKMEQGEFSAISNVVCLLADAINENKITKIDSLSFEFYGGGSLIEQLVRIFFSRLQSTCAIKNVAFSGEQFKCIGSAVELESLLRALPVNVEQVTLSSEEVKLDVFDRVKSLMRSVQRKKHLRVVYTRYASIFGLWGWSSEHREFTIGPPAPMVKSAAAIR